MPTNALTNPLVLPILGLLVERPRHGYAVFAELRRRYRYLRVRNATVYTLLNRLTDAGWVEAVEDKAKPALATTAAGRDAFAELVDRQLRTTDPADGTAFMTALAYLGILTPIAATAALQARLALIRGERHRIHQLVAESGVAELHMIEVHFYLDRLTQDAAWIAQTLRRIETGQLRWPPCRDPASPESPS